MYLYRVKTFSPITNWHYVVAENTKDAITYSGLSVADTETCTVDCMGEVKVSQTIRNKIVKFETKEL